MNAHPTVDLLSAWVDGELAGAERREVEEHLGDCGHCRGRVADFDRLAVALRSLEAAAPPAELGATVLRLASAEARRLHAPRRRAPQAALAAPPPLAMGVAVLAALAVAVVWFAYQKAAGEAAHRGAPWQVGPAVQAGDAPAPPVRRQWVHRAGCWVELGTDPGAVARKLQAADPDVEAIAGEVPELRHWLERGERLVLRWRGETVEVLPAAAPERAQR